MSVAWTTWKKEMVSYLFSPVGYIVLFLLYLWRGFEVSALIDPDMLVEIEAEAIVPESDHDHAGA